MSKKPQQDQPEILTLTISDLNNLGCGVGRAQAGADQGTVVFVKGAVTGDVVRAQIIKRAKSFLVGRLVEVVTPSPLRETETFCTAPEACGGCVYRHIQYEAELTSKQERVKQAFRQAGLSDVTVRPVLTVKREAEHGGEHVTRGYRNKGMYPVKQGKSGMEAGFFAAKTHKVIPCSDCALQPEVFGELVRAVCKLCDKYRITAYEEPAHENQRGKGTLRHIYIRSAADGSMLLTLVINDSRLPRPAAEGLVHELVGRFPKLCGILLNVNRENTNVVLGEKFVTLWGKDYLEDTLCGKKLRLSAGSFYQVNHDAAELLYNTAADMAGLTGQEHLLDLYCGAGSIGLSMADRVADVTGIEIVPEAVECAKVNAALNGLGTDRARFFCGDASDAHKFLAAAEEGGAPRPDLAVIDPPRKGTTRELISEIAARDIRRVVYISCEPETLGRDCAVFREFGYEIGEVQPVDLFPRTGHVESVVCLTRRIDN
jgi:23S rRNA (uracil1939-C5)-methyltransferase